jgi:hypothetical protein
MKIVGERMRKLLVTLAGASAAIASMPAVAQSWQDQQRWDYAQQRFHGEQQRFQVEKDRYFAAVRADHPEGYPPPPPPPGSYRDPYATDYDAARDYRDDPRYQPRRLSSQDQVYRGGDGRYYCKRNDGTTGLIIGAAGGGVLGNILDGGHNRAAGTLIGGALGALAGKSIDQNNVQCR